VDTDPDVEIIANNGYVFDGKTQQNKWAYGPGFAARSTSATSVATVWQKIVGLIPGGPARCSMPCAEVAGVGNSRRNMGFFGAESGRPRWRQAGRDHRR